MVTHSDSAMDKDSDLLALTETRVVRARVWHKCAELRHPRKLRMLGMASLPLPRFKEPTKTRKHLFLCFIF